MKKRRRKALFNKKWRNFVLEVHAKCDDCNDKVLYFCRYDAIVPMRNIRNVSIENSKALHENMAFRQQMGRN